MKPAGWPCAHDKAVIQLTDPSSLAEQTDTCHAQAAQLITQNQLHKQQ